jgi:hypothetical protein
LTVTWEFSAANAIFTSTLFVIVPVVLWVKLKRQRLAIEEGMASFRKEIAPIQEAMFKLSGTFLLEKVHTLEQEVEHIGVRLEHIEAMLEASHRQP